MVKSKFNLMVFIILVGVIIGVMVLLFYPNPSSDLNPEKGHQAKNIILMVADGMGLADVTAARIYKNGLDGAPLYLETLENIGYQRTFPSNSTVTDSAAAASAWACGEKFNNGEICYHSDGRPHNNSILELSKSYGKAAGLIATSRVTHATPAAFGSHVRSRKCENEIARQLIVETKVDVMLNADYKIFNSTEEDECGSKGNLIQEAVRNGYSLAYTKEEMNNSSRNGNTRLIGFFAINAISPEILHLDTDEPGLSEMTSATLDMLEEDSEGFFLLVESSNIDSWNEINNMTYQVHEVLGFDDAVKVVMDWINADSRRKEDTLLIVTADHDSGGFAINGPVGNMAKKLDYVEAGWTVKGHTGVDTIIWSQGPGSEKLGKAIDNTEIYYVMAGIDNRH